MSSFASWLAGHSAASNAALGGEQLLYSPSNGSPTFFITGIVHVGDQFEQGVGGAYAASVSNVLDTDFTESPSNMGYVPISGDLVTRQNAKLYDVYHVGNVDEAGTRTLMLREARI